MATKINWVRALVDYIYDVTASYASIASKYGVSLQAVKKRASRDGWQELRRKTIQKVNQGLPEKVGETLAEVNARHAQIGIELQKMAADAIESGRVQPRTFNEARQMLVDGVKIERDALNLDQIPRQPQAVQINFGSQEVEEWAK